MLDFLAVLVVALLPPQEAEETPYPDWELELLPGKVVYAPYLADPRQPYTGARLQFPVRKSRDVKIENVVGTWQPLALWEDPDNPDESAEFFIEGAVFSRFDLNQRWDMDGADYRFGFPFAYRYKDVAGKFHVYHLTSHLGDEYIEREGRSRDIYHLEEAALGYSWQADPSVRLYAEVGAAFYAGPKTESGRGQLGAEWVGPVWEWNLRPFAALDLQTRNEIDWDVNGNVVAGLLARGKSGTNGLRFTLEYFRGHDLQTQFKAHFDQYWAFGVGAGF